MICICVIALQIINAIFLRQIQFIMAGIRRGQKVTLIRVDLGITKEFGPQHAENLLTMRAPSWALPEDSKYKIENGELIRSRGNQQNTEPQQQEQSTDRALPQAASEG